MPLETRPTIEFDAEFLRKLEVLNVVAKKILSGALRAERKSHRKGASAEFADHRPYVPGDDPRYVDWHIFGRLEELFLKLYREEENLHLSILLDTSSSMNCGSTNKLGYGLQLAAALAYVGMANMDAVNIVPFGARLQEGRWGLRGRGQIFRLFEFLQDLSPTGETEMMPSVREFMGKERRRGLIVVLSDMFDLRGYQPALKSLRYQRNDVYVIHLVDREETEPVFRGDLCLVDAEGQGSKNINVTDQLLQQYQDAFQQHVEGVQRFCLRNQMGYSLGRTEIPFNDLILGILRRGGLLG